MIVQCEQCQTRFRLDEGKISARGAQVRCSKCGHNFVVQKPSAPPRLPMFVPASAPVAPTAVPPPVPGIGAEDFVPPPLPEAAAGTAPVSPPTASGIGAGAVPSGFGSPGTAPAAGAAVPAQAVVQSGVSSLVATPASPSSAPAAVQPNGSAVTAALPPVVQSGTALMPSSVPPGPPVVQSGASSVLMPGSFSAVSGATSLGAGPASSEPVLTDDLFADLEPPPGEGGAEPLEPFADMDSHVSSRAVAPPPLMDGVEPPAASPHSPGRLAVIGNLVLTILALGVLSFGLLFFAAGDRLHLRSLADAGARGSEAFLGVRIDAMRSVLFTNDAGHELLVVSGEATNQSKRPRPHIDVVAELRNTKGKVVQRARAPLGLSLTPTELAQVTTPASLTSMLQHAAANTPHYAVAPGAAAFYTVVFTTPPPHPERFVQAVHLEQGKAIEPPPPPPVAAPKPPPPEEHEASDHGRRHGRRRGHFRGRRRHQRRRGHAKPADRAGRP